MIIFIFSAIAIIIGNRPGKFNRFFEKSSVTVL